MTNDDRLDAVARALSDRTRRALLTHLAGRISDLSVLSIQLKAPESVVARHLRILARAGLVTCSTTEYSDKAEFSPEPLLELDAWLDLLHLLGTPNRQQASR
jgi:DNA-binding transcriptional ArsR family regulator